MYVETAHTITGMSLPVDGELILASGAGFTVREGGDPGCGSGVTAHFKDPESQKWFDPSLWVAATTIDDLHRGTYQFQSTRRVSRASMMTWYFERPPHSVWTFHLIMTCL